MNPSDPTPLPPDWAAQTAQRQALADTARAMVAAGLNKGSAGNLSCRARLAGEDGFYITPTGMDYGGLTAQDIPFVALASGAPTGPRKPSSEWRMHRDVYLARPEAGAVLHAHSPFAVALACLRRDVPPFHYMIARFGGDTVRCSAYATFGTQALSDTAVEAMTGRRACLLANHGMLVFGGELQQALGLGVELETLCEQYWRACQLGQPVLLDPAQMEEALEKFASYGKQD
ncbi:class II aldolase/adducin family protein [Azospira inquinata]|uniref:Class II aldolase/adducin family protein n=1 Tax=Azospira inquinata TaxID=2785627 RepID=A0A975SL26_9RHOO|nr:class II aldolase/adducin family protein [Azospira inquinata]QWT46367.1 class II aldolase/adducin family protein [Azospira inquinata]QWT48307.1 class II aldolase/adducin family protein [Azospira inquinata]